MSDVTPISRRRKIAVLSTTLAASAIIAGGSALALQAGPGPSGHAARGGVSAQDVHFNASCDDGSQDLTTDSNEAQILTHDDHGHSDDHSGDQDCPPSADPSDGPQTSAGEDPAPVNPPVSTRPSPSSDTPVVGTSATCNIFRLQGDSQRTTTSNTFPVGSKVAVTVPGVTGEAVVTINAKDDFSCLSMSPDLLAAFGDQTEVKDAHIVLKSLD